MDSISKGDLEKIIGNALEKKILPELKEIKTKLKEHDEKFEKHGKKLDNIMEAVAETKVEITVLQEDVSDQGYTLERIETKLSSTTCRQDDFSVKADQLNRRVLKLETKKA
ncbi:MAG: hypothetical protein US31_C0006G0059 [Berkelbacteria bacterium GW2011_GWA1_36_9]|uniref:Uncharacterized protein n=1 Tax=Berkelbacteria bacterium GW2011_GWA1_36_9 TaxID=1618331 RepID=A0A0G0FGW5_9BACT|nr:MAG: hypothetical protein US31_C0006G0059 [Berkelbacteria bacterium GW2011_GWA1_36_9]